ncbi:uncharacterized protein BDV14DRAFT_197213 [Aspergillus stella-maris]|uniref:uncharacterized protein n=1 Tax=Aspergillus stella-maris TaxID=1810926 RepID=UPI003CCDC0CF
MQRVAQLSTRAGAFLKQQSFTSPARCIFSTSQLQSSSGPDKASPNADQPNQSKQPSTPEQEKARKTVKTVAQEDEELRRRLEERSGEGGAAGLEYEDGKPQTMKRSVRNNMFRYI